MKKQGVKWVGKQVSSQKQTKIQVKGPYRSGHEIPEKVIVRKDGRGCKAEDP